MAVSELRILHKQALPADNYCNHALASATPKAGFPESRYTFLTVFTAPCTLCGRTNVPFASVVSSGIRMA
jgi:hypothetical protein